MLYRAEHELDKAWCVAQALTFLGVASDEERLLYESSGRCSSRWRRAG